MKLTNEYLFCTPVYGSHEQSSWTECSQLPFLPLNSVCPRWRNTCPVLSTFFLLLLPLLCLSIFLLICTTSAYVYCKSILKEMQYRFAVNFGTLSISIGGDPGQYYAVMGRCIGFVGRPRYIFSGSLIGRVVSRGARLCGVIGRIFAISSGRGAD